MAQPTLSIQLKELATGTEQTAMAGLMVTNMDLEGGQLAGWHWARCDDSEATHAVMKDEIPGGCLPSRKFVPTRGRRS